MLKPLPILRQLVNWGRKPFARSSAASPTQATSSFRKSLVILILAVICLTGAVGERFYHDPELGVGTPAPQTITAPASDSFEDTAATQAMRKAARRGTLPLLMLDKQINKQIIQDLNQKFVKGDQLRAVAGPFPFTSTSTLSTPTQLYLRSAAKAELDTIINAATQSQVSGQLESATQRAIVELRTYRANASSQDWSQSTDRVAQVQTSYQTALVKLSQSQPAYPASLLNLSDQTWRATKQETLVIARRILAQGISPGLPRSFIENIVRVNIGSLAPTVQPLSGQILSGVLRPNLIIDPDATQQRAEQAAQEVQPVTLTVQQGEVIVQAGAPINHEAFVLLDHFGLSQRGINWPGLISLGILVSGAVSIFWIVTTRTHLRLSQQDYMLVLLLTLSAPLLTSTLGISYNSLPAVGLLLGSFYGSALGATVVGLTTALLLSIEISSGWIELFAIATSSLVGSIMAGRLRSREELALLGGVIALVQGGIYLALSAPTGLAWYNLLSGAGLQSLIGLGWSVVALGISPYLERLFGLVTPIRLAELSNPNRPMLKRLALEAPGTFQHTLLVAMLAEAAARTLGSNVELVRAGTLYHDIGKLHDPLSFIENQMGRPNKHDAINDPWQSAAIIKKHVSEGLAMARKCRLPKAIQAFIAEHHGTTQVAYFYYQAQKQVEEMPDRLLQESDFRYAGPIPQSKETAIVMLADSCEAALRSLREASSEEALTTINKIFKARWQENQLTDSQLTRADLSRIARIFVQVWQQFNHKRIRYPSTSLLVAPKISSS